MLAVVEKAEVADMRDALGTERDEVVPRLSGVRAEVDSVVQDGDGLSVDLARRAQQTEVLSWREQVGLRPRGTSVRPAVQDKPVDPVPEARRQVEDRQAPPASPRAG
jgi:hypothetical protein